MIAVLSNTEELLQHLFPSNGNVGQKAGGALGSSDDVFG